MAHEKRLNHKKESLFKGITNMLKNNDFKDLSKWQYLGDTKDIQDKLDRLKSNKEAAFTYMLQEE